jgi:hypothetical protein
MWYSDIKKNYFSSRRILHQHWYTCPISLPVRRNPQHKSLLALVSATYAPPFQPFRHQRNTFNPVVNRFTRQTLPTINRKHFFTNILFIESSCPQKRTTKLCSSVVQSSSTVDILTTETSLWTYASYLDVHDARLCCYLVIHTEILLLPLQLFYFHFELFTDRPS